MSRNNLALRFSLAVALLATGIGSASADSCASRFVGSYIVTVRATGQTYPAQLSPGGVTHAQCPMCNPTGSWTCSGSTAALSVNGITITYSLSGDGRTMSGSCCVLSRLGGAPKLPSTDQASAAPGESKNNPQPNSSRPKGQDAAPQSKSPGSGGGPNTTNANPAAPATPGVPGAGKALPVPPTVPAPTAGAQSRQQITVARRSEETSIFRSSSSSSSSSGECTDDVGPGMLLVDPGISLIGSGNCQSNAANTPAQHVTTLRRFVKRLPPDDPRIPMLLAAILALNKQNPKDTPSPQDLQCMLSPPESGSDEPLKPLQICWGLDQIKEATQVAGLCQGITDDAELEDCEQQNLGYAVLAVEPELSRYCYAGPDYGGDMAECAKRKFLKAWDDFHRNFDMSKGLAFDDPRRHPTSDGGHGGPCAIVPPPDPATWSTPGTATCTPKVRQGLRNKIRCQLHPELCGGTPNNDDTPDASQNPPQQQDTQANSPPEPPPLPKEDEAWCNYIADAHRRGDLGGIPIPPECPREKAAYTKPPPADPLFSMNPIETEQAIKDLIKDAPTKPVTGVLNMTPDELSKVPK